MISSSYRNVKIRDSVTIPNADKHNDNPDLIYWVNPLNSSIKYAFILILNVPLISLSLEKYLI